MQQDSVFNSMFFKGSLWLLGIKKQTTQLHHPWQNGRIERLFLTLKEKINQVKVYNPEGLDSVLKNFRFWYNHVRTHQYLKGQTPAEVWSGQKLSTLKAKKEYYYEELDGLLRGFYFH